MDMTSCHNWNFQLEIFELSKLGEKTNTLYETTVGGGEILHQLRLVVYPHYLQGFSTITGGDRRISEPSTVTASLGP